MPPTWLIVWYLPKDVNDDNELNQPVHDANFLVVDVHYLCRVVLEDGGRRCERVATQACFGENRRQLGAHLARASSW